MNVFLFGIGGTGARILRSLTHSLAANVADLPGDVSFVPIIIDHDQTNGDKTVAIDTMEKYMAIRSKAYKDFKYDDDYRSFFLPQIKYLNQVPLTAGQTSGELKNTFECVFGVGHKSGNGTFGEYLDLKYMNGEYSESQNLLKALYNDSPSELQNEDGKAIDNPLAELELNLSVGFRGNPNVGTVIFDTIAETKEFDRFLKVFDSQKDCVILIGSIFGGTGSSGIPKILEAIRTCGVTGISKAKIAGIMVMPYFKVNTPKNSAVPPAIHDNIFKSKQKAALSFYDGSYINNQNLNANFDAIYYVAEESSKQTQHPYAEGDKEQRNVANIIELISAWGILDFVKKVQTGASLSPQFLEYGLKADSTGEAKLTIRNFEDCERPTLKNLAAFTFFVKHYKDWVAAKKVKSKTSYYGDNGLKLAEKLDLGMFADLKEFSAMYWEWLHQLSDNKHGFEPFDLKDDIELNEMVHGFSSSKGSLFSEGVSHSEYDSFAAKAYSKHHGLENKDQVFLKIMFEGAQKETDLATRRMI